MDPRIPGRWSATTAGLAAVLLLAPSMAFGSSDTGDVESVAAAVAIREVFGLPTDANTIDRLLEGAEDVGTAEVGFPLTATELASLDLVGRMTFVNDLERDVLPMLRSLSTFAGVWIDQRNGGRLVVMLTELDASVEASLKESLPAGGRGAVIVQAAHTYEALRRAVGRARGEWGQLAPTLPVLGVGLDTPRNGLRLVVSAQDVTVAEPRAGELSSILGVPVYLEPGLQGSDVVCTNRDNCHTPLRGGVMIRKGAVGSANNCTMGFHIRIGTDEQFLTAGHCGHFGSNNWYHNGLGLIGAEAGTLYGAGGKDVMRVQMADAQASTLIYGDGAFMGSAALPVPGEAVCASLAQTNAKKCGTVTDDWWSWTSETANVTVWGGDSNLAPIDGDSGSPIYRKVLLGGDYYFIPIGIMDHENGGFARVVDALNAWNAVIVQ